MLKKEETATNNFYTSLLGHKQTQGQPQANLGYETIIDSISDIVSIQDKDFKLIKVNKAYADAFKMKPAELVGRTCYQIVHQSKKPIAGCPHMRVLTTKKPVVVEIFEPRLGVYLEISVWPVFNKEGEVAATIHIAKDITDRKRAEEAKNKELEQSTQTKSEFLASMSHELRTPLNAVIGFSELMLDGAAGEMNDKQKDCLTDILESGEYLLKLINDVLDLSKVEAGEMELRIESLGLADVVTEVSQTVKPMVDNKKLELRVNLQKGLPRVSADRTKLKQVFLNLMSNSIKFTPAGGNITVQGSIKDEWCYVSVVDNGIGISKEDQERIFQPFVQGKTLPEKTKEGIGLGLTLSRKFVEACGGKIWVESEQGKGAKFTFTLPLVKEGEPYHGAEKKKPAEVIHRVRQIPREPGQKTILVVDDDRKSRSLMEAWLREEGYDVVQASSGDEGIRKAKELIPTAIILDILMPDKDGWQVLQELKSTPEMRNIPVIIASVVEEKELSFSLGAVDYFVKPVNKRGFLERIASLGVTSGKEVLAVVDDNPADVRLVVSILEAESIKVLRAYGGYEGLRIAREHKPV